MRYISKTVDRRAKRIEIFDSWILVTHLWGTFELVSCHFGIIWCIFLKMACDATTAGLRASERMKFGTRGY